MSAPSAESNGIPWAAAPALPADPRPGTRELPSTVLGALRIDLLDCSSTRVVARLSPSPGATATAGELLVLAETVASTAAGLNAGDACRAFGAELNAALPARPAPGPVRATATPLRVDHALHHWRVVAQDATDQVVLEGRCTLAITRR